MRRGRGQTELRFEARNLRPTIDFGVLLGDPGRIEAGLTIGDGSVDFGECPGALGDAAWLADATDDELDACRHLVRALSGERFEDARWSRALYGGAEPAPSMGEEWTVETIRPATGFEAAQLPPAHAALVRRIDAELARRSRVTGRRGP